MNRAHSPEATAQVERLFYQYEDALRANDVESLTGFFLTSSETVRYGIGEIQYGSEAIAEWRSSCPPIPQGRELMDTFFLRLSEDAVVANTLFCYRGEPGLGRQTQLWVRSGQGFKIAFAHVSVCVGEDIPISGTLADGFAGELPTGSRLTVSRSAGKPVPGIGGGR